MSSEQNPSRLQQLRSAASTTRRLAGMWAQAKTAKLQAQVNPPDSWIEALGSSDGDRYQDRKATRDQLKKYHEVRVDGGIVATLLEARALMVFGVGGQFTSEDDEVQEWLNEQFNDTANLVYDIGADTYFYGYSLGEIRETNGGDFGDIKLIQPWTTAPKQNRKGEIEEWEQEIKRHGKKHTQTFSPDEVVHFKTMKSSGRDEVGMSLLGRSMDEANAFRDNQRAIQNAVQMQGYPKFHVKLGREGGAVIDDNELRRARPMFDNIHELTKWVTGQDVDIDVIEAENFDFEGITEHDLSKLAIAYMLPIELTQIGGGDGLGTGFPAKLRKQLFILSARSHQRLLGDQLVQQVGRPLLEEYSPYDPETPIDYVFDDPITDVEELDTMVQAIGDDMTVNERREVFDLPPLDDESVGEDFDSPGDSGGDDAAGLFQQDTALQDVDREDVWMQIYRDRIWTEDSDQALLAFSESGIPDFVRQRIREAILSGALFSDFEDIPGSDLMDLRLEFADTLTSDGWTISELTERIQDLQPDLSESEAEAIARTETASTVNKARELGYREREDFQELQFRWVGPSDGRTTDACEELKELTEDGVSWERLMELEREVHDEYFPDLQFRKHVIHPNERHTFTRYVR